MLEEYTCPLTPALTLDGHDIAQFDKSGPGVERRIADEDRSPRFPHDMAFIDFAVFHDDFVRPGKAGQGTQAGGKSDMFQHEADQPGAVEIRTIKYSVSPKMEEGNNRCCS